jgi:hypothetical protein
MTITQWADGVGNLGADREEVFVADFTGDGRADLAFHDLQTGDWHVARSTGEGFEVTRWATSFGNLGTTRERSVVGDFDADGRADIAVHDTVTGNWWVGRSTGAAFTIEAWATGFGNQGRGREAVHVGDFTGDGRSDVAVHDQASGDWWIGRATDSGFEVELWAVSFGNRADRERLYIHDLDGDGRADVVIHDVRAGDWWVGRSTGRGFILELWATSFGNQGASRESVLVGDFTGDGLADVAVHERATGRWWLGRSTGSNLTVAPWAEGFGTRGDIERVLTGG